MGNVSPIGDAEKTRLEELTKSILTTFVKEFALAVPLAVLQVSQNVFSFKFPLFSSLQS
jgi:hypothetical protein